MADYGTFEFSLASGAFAADGEPDVLACLMEESFFLPGDWSGGDIEAVDRAHRRPGSRSSGR